MIRRAGGIETPVKAAAMPAFAPAELKASVRKKHEAAREDERHGGRERWMRVVSLPQHRGHDGSRRAQERH